MIEPRLKGRDWKWWLNLACGLIFLIVSIQELWQQEMRGIISLLFSLRCFYDVFWFTPPAHQGPVQLHLSDNAEQITRSHQ